MGIKEFVNNKLKEIKEKRETQRELNQIQHNAYLEEMKKQSKLMGEKQAKIDSEMREKSYKRKLEYKYNKNDPNKKEENKTDYFGLDRAFGGYIN